jgi:hypothetical protein
VSDSLVWRLIMHDNADPGAATFRKKLEQVREDTDRHAGAFKRAGEVTEGFSKTLMHGSAVIGTASTALVNGAGAAVAFAHAAAVSSGALLLLPGAVAAAGVANVALKVGLSGVSDAFKLSTAGGKEYEAALKNLAPEQAKFVRATAGQSKAWSDVKKSVGGALFKDLSLAVKPLADKYLPAMKSGLGEVAKGLNEGAFQLGVWAMQPEVVSKFNGILHNSATVITSVVKAARPLANALLNVFSASTSSLTNYTGGFQKFANRFDDFIFRVTDNGKGGQFAVWIKNGTSEISKLADGVGSLVNKAKDPAFQSTLITVWQGMQKSAAAVNKELPLVIQAVEDLAPAFANVLAAGGSSFGATLHTVATMAIALAPTLNAVSTALLPWAPLLGAISPYLFLAAKGMKAWSVIGPIVKAVRAWTVAQGGLNAVLAANPIGLTVIAIGLLIAAFVLAYKKVDWFRYGVNSVVKSVGNAFLDMVQSIVHAFGTLYSVLGKLPGKAGAPFRAAAAAAAKAEDKINDVRHALNRLPTKKTINVTVSTHATGGNTAVQGYGLGYLMRADGGPVKAGQPYIVGERRPELFVPSQDGEIIPRVPEKGGGYSAWGGGSAAGLHVTVIVQGNALASRREIQAAVVDAFHAAPAGARTLPARAVAAR